MEQTLNQMNPWWEKNNFETGIIRNKYLKNLLLHLEKKEIIFITGLRRIGKTTLLKQVINHLLNSVEANKILYVTLDFFLFKDKSLHQIIQEFRKLHMHKISEKIYLFLDEITQIKDFEKELKNLYDLENVKIYASSSSASLIKSKESYLVGRSRLIEVLPLDFEEFLLFNNLKVSKADSHLLKKYFEDYLKMGGLPEYVLTKDTSYIKNTIEQIIYKDVIALHHIKDKDSVEKLFILLCERAGKKFSYSKLARILGISVDTVRRFISYFKDVFLFYTIDKYAKSLNERTFSPKKIYIADIGIKNVFAGFKDKGSLFENLVFLKIKDKNPRYYFEHGKEIDFIVNNTAIETKYKNVIEEKELKFFNKAKFKRKILISNFEELKNIIMQLEKTDVQK
ncbi:AAA family ATPase [Candidatus Woesearchaeota archaeon CG10_big_fil_rev_8_21_14_0_10_30_7]|nr:MAG: AAA family ATPase [Candidatus Woesearchaeota archaeon CG10_big_fil_rev_8_21_14_0_10_30_7]